jgi:hypothetical protein
LANLVSSALIIFSVGILTEIALPLAICFLFSFGGFDGGFS